MVKSLFMIAKGILHGSLILKSPKIELPEKPCEECPVVVFVYVQPRYHGVFVIHRR